MSTTRRYLGQEIETVYASHYVAGRRYESISDAKAAIKAEVVARREEAEILAAHRAHLASY